MIQLITKLTTSFLLAITFISLYGAQGPVHPILVGVNSSSSAAKITMAAVTQQKALAQAQATSALTNAQNKFMIDLRQSYSASCKASEAVAKGLYEKYTDELSKASYTTLAQSAEAAKEELKTFTKDLHTKTSKLESFLQYHLQLQTPLHQAKQEEFNKALGLLAREPLKAYYVQLSEIRDLEIRISTLQDFMQTYSEVLHNFEGFVGNAQSKSSSELMTYTLPQLDHNIKILSAHQAEKKIELTKLRLQKEYIQHILELRAAIKAKEASNIAEFQGKTPPNATAAAVSQTAKEQGEPKHQVYNKLTDEAKKFLKDYNLSAEQFEATKCTALEKHLLEQINTTVNKLGTLEAALKNNPQSELSKLVQAAFESCSEATQAVKTQTAQEGIIKSNAAMIRALGTVGMLSGTVLLSTRGNYRQALCHFGNALQRSYLQNANNSSVNNSSQRENQGSSNAATTASSSDKHAESNTNKAGEKESSKASSSTPTTSHKTPNNDDFVVTEICDKMIGILSETFPLINNNYAQLFGSLLCRYFTQPNPDAVNSKTLSNAFNNFQLIPQQLREKISVELIANLFDPTSVLSPETLKFIADANTLELWDTRLKGALVNKKQALAHIMITRDIAHTQGHNFNSGVLPMVAAAARAGDIPDILQANREGYTDNKKTADIILDLATAENIFNKAAQATDSIGNWDMPSNGWIIGGRLFTQRALERMAPCTHRMREELRTRAHRNGLVSGPQYDDFIQSLGISPKQVAEVLGTGTWTPNIRESRNVFRTNTLFVFTNPRGDVLDISRNS